MMDIVLNFAWMNTSILPPILLVILVCVIIILIYLYKSSEFIDKKIFTWILCIIIVFFVVANILIIYKNLPPDVKFRLLPYAAPHLTAAFHKVCK